MQDDHEMMLDRPDEWRPLTIEWSIKEGENRRNSARKTTRGQCHEVIKRTSRASVAAKKNLNDMIPYTKTQYHKTIGWENDYTREESDARWEAAFNAQHPTGERIMKDDEGWVLNPMGLIWKYLESEM